MTEQSNLCASDIPVPHTAVITALFDVGEFAVTLFDQRSTSVHRLNQSAAAVWTLCDGMTTVEQIEVEMADAFSVERSLIHSDVQAALRSLWQLGVLESTRWPSIDESDLHASSGVRILERIPDP